jgi:hypothetical protein
MFSTAATAATAEISKLVITRLVPTNLRFRAVFVKCLKANKKG